MKNIKIREVGRMLSVRTKVIPVVVGALGTVPLRLKDNLKAVGVGTSILLIQKSASGVGVGKDTEERC